MVSYYTVTIFQVSIFLSIYSFINLSKYIYIYLFIYLSCFLSCLSYYVFITIYVLDGQNPNQREFCRHFGCRTVRHRVHNVVVHSNPGGQKNSSIYIISDHVSGKCCGWFDSYILQVSFICILNL